MPKLAPVIRIGLTLLGVLMVIAAFLGVLYLGIGTNPPPLRIAVAAHDLLQGEYLTSGAYRIVDQIVDPRLASLYVQENELADYDGAFIVETLRKGDPINKVKLALDGTTALTRRYALALQNPDDVIMTLPVNPDVIPAKVSSGDFVNILFAGGNESGLSRLPESTPVPDLPIANSDPLLMEPISITTSQPDAIALPLADLMLEHVLVLDVNFQPTSQGYNETGTEQVVADGPISSIVVKVPRSHQTLLMFGASTSKLRFAIASPALETHQLQPQMGMDWAKYMALYRWKESQVLARGETLTQTLFPSHTVPAVTLPEAAVAAQPTAMPNPPAPTPTVVSQ